MPRSLLSHGRRHAIWTLGSRPFSWLAPVLVGLAILGFAGLYSWLAILRHQTFGSAAMDLGYTDQVVWNTLRGRLFCFSTLQNARIDLPLAQFRRTDILLAYHVELLLVPISWLYLIYESPLTLLVLQATGVALGAWPAFLLAREHLQSDLAGVTFALAYLLAPAVEGAVLTDFHAVALTASLLMFALYFLHRRQFGGFFAFCVAAMLAREDIPLLVFMLGLYIVVVLRVRGLGLLTAGMGLGWFAACTWVILPYFNGLGGSPFLQRVLVFGATPRESLSNLMRDPLLLWRWLAKPEIVAYLGGLLASAGFMSLFSPPVLGIAAPVLAINVFSNWSWTYSGGDHYSASVMPFVIVSAIYGLGSLAGRLASWLHIARQHVVVGLSLVVIGASLVHHYWLGVSPLARTFYPPQITAHHRLGHALLRLIPPDASVSAQSQLYPHVAHRERAYFFPAINDAEYVFLDVTSPSYPLTVQGIYFEVRQLLRAEGYGVRAAEDGYLLLQKGLPRSLVSELPESFYGFAYGTEAEMPHRLGARLGDVLELVGYDCNVLNVVDAQQLPATVTTYWRVLLPLEMDYQFAFFFTRADGAIVYLYHDATPTTAWRPPRDWVPGEIMRLETPLLAVGRLHEALVAVVPRARDAWKTENRLKVQSVGEYGAIVYDGGTLLRLLRFP